VQVLHSVKAINVIKLRFHFQN